MTTWFLLRLVIYWWRDFTLHYITLQVNDERMNETSEQEETIQLNFLVNEVKEEM